MDALFWTEVVTGSVLVALGLVALMRLVPGVPREQGWPALGMGVSAILLGIVRARQLPGEDWVLGLAVVIIFSAVFLQWRTYRARKPGG
jgi:hypothetical protein